MPKKYKDEQSDDQFKHNFKEHIKEHKKHHKKGFPIFATILLVIAILWTLSELKVLTINIPWIPIILGVIAIGLIVNRIIKKS